MKFNYFIRLFKKGFVFTVIETISVLIMQSVLYNVEFSSGIKVNNSLVFLAYILALFLLNGFLIEWVNKLIKK